MRSPHIGQGSNSANVRRYNERLLRRRCGAPSPHRKADLALHANITSTAVGSIITSLGKAGLDRVHGTAPRRPARAARGADPARSARRVRCRRAARAHERGDGARELRGCGARAHVVRHASFPHPNEVLDFLTRDIRSMLQLLTRTSASGSRAWVSRSRFQSRQLAARLGLPSEHIRAWDEMELPGRARTRPCAARVQRKLAGNAAAIAELFYGCGRQRNDFIYLFLGPAIGSGIAVDGDYLRGVSGYAGRHRRDADGAERTFGAPAGAAGGTSCSRAHVSQCSGTPPALHGRAGPARAAESEACVERAVCRP